MVAGCVCVSVYHLKVQWLWSVLVSIHVVIHAVACCPRGRRGLGGGRAFPALVEQHVGRLRLQGQKDGGVSTTQNHTSPDTKREEAWDTQRSQGESTHVSPRSGPLWPTRRCCRQSSTSLRPLCSCRRPCLSGGKGQRRQFPFLSLFMQEIQHLIRSRDGRVI